MVGDRIPSPSVLSFGGGGGKLALEYAVRLLLVRVLRPSCLPVAIMVGVSLARAKSKAHRMPFKGSGGFPLIPALRNLAFAIGEVGVIQVQVARGRWRRPGSGGVKSDSQIFQEPL